MTIYDNQVLYDTLKEIAIIPQQQLDEALVVSKDKKFPLDKVLLEKDLISDEQLGRIIADSANFPFIRLSQVSIPNQILQIIPEVVAKKQKIFAFRNDKHGLHLAMTDPKNKEIQQFLAKKTGEQVIPYFATNKDIDEALTLYHKDIKTPFDQILKKQDVPIPKMVDLLIEYAYHNKASDIHIEPTDQNSLVRFRIDGVLHDVLNLPNQLHDQIISRIKVLAKLQTDEHLNAQDGKMQVKLEEEELDIRVSIIPITDGEKAVLRLLSSKSRQFSLLDLGISEKDLKIVTNGYEKASGMVLATGPTGCGKTTTVYAVLKILNTRDKNIATIEDPVEYDIEGINQIQVTRKANLTFANGLRSILRQDPDIIFVGEIRDKETAEIATNSAMTGHLVLSTMHTNDAATTLPRLIDMGIEPYLVASTINIIIAQRLVRKICQSCRVSQIMTFEELSKQVNLDLIKKHFDLTGQINGEEIRVYHGKGCDICHSTGYLGRVGIFEVLEVSEAIKELISAKVNADVIKKKAIEEGMASMLDDGLEKVARGITTVEEVIRATKE